MTDQLRERLAAAQLRWRRNSAGELVPRTNEEIADGAVAVVQQWLRDQAGSGDYVWYTDGTREGLASDVVKVLADSLATDLGESR